MTVPIHEELRSGPIAAQAKDFLAEFGPYLTERDREYLKGHIATFEETKRISPHIQRWIGAKANEVEKARLKANLRPHTATNTTRERIERLRDRAATEGERRAAEEALKRIK